ncbi:MAG: hypothetical protein ACJA1A_002966 [Saprospiraceae bacterium]|jgi:hypothetical protein
MLVDIYQFYIALAFEKLIKLNEVDRNTSN